METVGFRVQAKPCATCIYSNSCLLDIKKLEAQISDGHGGFVTHRTCHHAIDVCCNGFWTRHKDEFPGGQIAQRLNRVQFVTVDVFGGNNDL